MKNTLSCSQSNPQNGENRILGLFLGKHVPRPPDPPPPIKKGPNAVEGPNVITGHKCNKVTSVITFGHKCNKGHKCNNI